MKRKLWALVFTVLLVGMFVPRARADEGNKEVIFSINGPVEMPGRVLAPGRYDLKLAEDNPSVAELWNAKGTKFYGFYETIPVDRSHVTDNVRFKLTETQSNAPERISAWFYPGDVQGNQFLYPAQKPPESEGYASSAQMSVR